MRRAALAPALLLAACSGAEQPAPSETTDETSIPPAAPAAPPQRQIGTVSGLQAESSGLDADVSDFVVERTDTGTRVELAADTLFEFDKAELSPDAQANLTRVADLVRQGGKGAVTITGHTDAKGEDAYNVDLSRRRADAVAGWLRTQSGLGERDFTVEGRGEADPVAPNAHPDGSDDPDGRARNRRVTIDIPK